LYRLIYYYIFTVDSSYYYMRSLINVFMSVLILLLLAGCNQKNGFIMTVKGPVKATEAGIWLTHEHVLVDFIGADSITPDRYDRQAVIAKVLPYLKEAKKLGCRTFAECTPEYLGRDPLLLKELADSTGLNILTNVGYYGARDNKFIPLPATTINAEMMARFWTEQWEKGIYDTGIKPGFIKIGVDKDSLSEFHQTLVRAAALTHLATGLTIASHTGPAIPAFQELEILKKEGVSPEAFIWVHASSEKDIEKLVAAAKMSAWISLDKLNDKNVDELLLTIKTLRDKGCLNRILLSHDAGWYDPAKENGGDFRGFTTLFEKLIPAMKSAGFSEVELKQILEINPAEAFSIKVRRLVN
jgi:phosphotriesterase-related protein